MNDQFGSLMFSLIWQLSVLIIVVGMVTRWLGRDRPHLSFALWLVVLAKCLTPPLYSSPSGVFCWLRAEKVSPVSQPVQSREVSTFPLPVEEDAVPQGLKLPADLPATRSVTEPSRSVGVATWWLAFWLLSSGVVFIHALVSWLRCVHKLRRHGSIAAPELQAAFERLAKKLRLGRSPRLLVTRCDIGPAVLGLWRPTVLLPAAVVEGKTVAQLEPILAHELIHVRRGDLWIGLFQTLAQSVWWFHPLIWLANRQLTREIERCCDEQVIAELRCRPADYARSLLAVLEMKHRLNAVPLFPGVRPVDVTYQRLERIMNLKQGCKGRTPWWCWLVALTVATVTLPGAALKVSAEEDHPAAKVGTNGPADSKSEQPDNKTESTISQVADQDLLDLLESRFPFNAQVVIEANETKPLKIHTETQTERVSTSIEHSEELTIDCLVNQKAVDALKIRMKSNLIRTDTSKTQTPSVIFLLHKEAYLKIGDFETDIEGTCVIFGPMYGLPTIIVLRPLPLPDRVTTFTLNNNQSWKVIKDKRNSHEEVSPNSSSLRVHTIPIPGEVVTRVYPVADLLLSDEKQTADVIAEQLAGLVQQIREDVAPESWKEFGGRGTMEGFAPNASLVVTQTELMHGKLADTLTKRRTQLVTRVYPVGDCIAGLGFSEEHVEDKLDALVGLLRQEVAPNSWRQKGGFGDVSAFVPNKSLVVTQTQGVHDKLKVRLRKLRDNIDLPIEMQFHVFTMDAKSWNAGGIGMDIESRPGELGFAFLTNTDRPRLFELLAARQAVKSYETPIQRIKSGHGIEFNAEVTLTDGTMMQVPVVVAPTVQPLPESAIQLELAIGATTPLAVLKNLQIVTLMSTSSSLLVDITEHLKNTSDTASLPDRVLLLIDARLTHRRRPGPPSWQ